MARAILKFFLGFAVGAVASLVCHFIDKHL